MGGAGLGLGCLHTLPKPYLLGDFVVVGVVLETNGKAPLFCRLEVERGGGRSEE